MIDVDRPAEPPPGLANGSYAATDVREALHAAFLGKCYLCETPVELGTFQVDHRKPKGEKRFAHLEHAWSNLFPVCKEHDCNQRRERRYPDGGLLDPGEGVEKRVVQRLERAASTLLRRPGSVDFVFRPSDPADIMAVNTATELDRIHNATGSRGVSQAEALRRKILEHIVAVTPHVYAMLMERPAERHTLAESTYLVRASVSRRAPYSMLVRSYFAHHAEVRALFD